MTAFYKTIDAGKYRNKIQIVKRQKVIDDDGFSSEKDIPIASPRAEVVTTAGYTLITNNTDFEEAMTRFTIRYSLAVAKAYENDNRKLSVIFRNKRYSIEYLNNIDEADRELELQCKAVTK